MTSSTGEPQAISLEGFLKRFDEQHRKQTEKPFCFILGAGASKNSGIPTGAELADQWVRDLHVEALDPKPPLQAWATEKSLGIPGFDFTKAATFYSHLYQRRFGKDPDRGYAFLEEAMAGKEPSFGYSVLAAILARTPHKVVITTNFDNLVADALSIYSTIFPLVLGDSSLAQYARVHLRRPMIAKIHGALGFAPLNKPDEVGKLQDEWSARLTELLQRYSPIVIGYDGNDRGLMGMLKGMAPGTIRGLAWCIYAPTGSRFNPLVSVPEPVRDLLVHHDGVVVPIPGFDELMLLLGQRLEIPDLLSELDDRHRIRIASYKDQQARLSLKIQDSKTSPERRTSDSVASEGALLSLALSDLAKQQKTKPWWEWEREAAAKSDPAEKDAVYREALKALPGNPQLLGNYANFLKNVRKDMDKAEKLYKQAIEADPKNAKNLGNYAIFLSDVRKDMDNAEKLYKQAIEADPTNANTLGNYANFLSDVRKDVDGAEKFFQLAIDADPLNANHFGNLAHCYLQQSKIELGLEQLEKAEKLNPSESELRSELLFYRLAHDRQAWPAKLGEMATLIRDGARSPGWPLEKHVEIAEAAGHPAPDLLRAIAGVIAHGEPIEGLSRFPEWAAASG